MSQQLIVKCSVTINTPASKVWEVLVKPQFIKQWDELPEDFGSQALSLGREIIWERENGGFVKLTVTDLEPNKLLRLSLYNSSWEQVPSAYDIAYVFKLSPQEESTQLEIEIGDFKSLPDGKDYYEASVEFGETAAQKIKELAEIKRLKPRISIITLAVDNLERSLNFYRDGLGLPTQGVTDDHVAFFLEGDLALVLYPRTEIAKIAKQAEVKPSSAECILSYTADNEEEVKEVLKRAEAAGATLPDKVEKQAWGGYSGHFMDPDGHLWQVMC